ncbi:MAG: aminotransferase class IV [Alphaproteobacteria bacterium]|jgi:branched-chain amino acid aminotransferase|nr:branched-chain amino acid transferase [Rhodospirillaceae bacterium]MDP6403808.1 aminotransferase class IV [Alphaproteobacteria bacterium]MDP6623966.1 aminotransferase class IV [Alphaproteobacteria bacterium]|tara:strand:- start:143 stop:1060 length:918 start_codon:yes stop_codon:yes gene_type:complete
MADNGADYSAGIAYVEGAFVPVGEAKVSLLDWGFLRSDANQDTVSVWRGQFFRLEDHLDRFLRNIAKLRMTSPLPRDGIRDVLFECVRRTGFREAYVQFLMTRGRPPIGSRDPRLAENKFFAFCIPYVWIATPEQQERGLHLTVSPYRRVPPESVDPTVKHYHWLDFEMSLFDALDQGADTTVLLDLQGNVSEGPGFNIFLLRGGRLVTPTGSVLDGMTRATVFELCGETNLAVEEADIPAAELASADEVFLSSTAGGIIPIRRVDEHDVGDGTPGPVTRRLRELYWQKREGGWHGTPATYQDDD